MVTRTVISTETRYAVAVVGGPDHGIRLSVDEQVRTIGRASDADLVLRDPAVSRRHVQVTATSEGAAFVVCGDAASIIANGVATRATDAKPGANITVGGTVLTVVSLSPDAGAREEWGNLRTDVGTLLTGVAADTRAIAAVHALVELLDGASDRAKLEAAFTRWATQHMSAVGVEFLSSEALDPAAVETSLADGDVTRIVFPAPSDEPMRVAVRCGLRSDRVTDAFRRTLVVAGRVFGSSVARVRRLEVSRAEAASLRAISFGSSRGFLGSSPAAERVATLIPRLAVSDVAVLIGGETGVGKTFVARLIHEAGPRSTEPLRIVNCAAIPENLAEAELFGHERGAFTGAVAGREGAFESAGRGTLFLDEIGELSLSVQAKLLRVLEERKFERVGSNRSIDVRARIICATNRNLEKMIAEKAFRSDLFFRIAVVRMAVPALRERGDDLVLLAQQILADVAQTAGRRITGYSPAALEVIRGYAWPGNVRELRNAVEHAVALGDGGLVEPADLPIGVGVAAPQPDDADVVQLPLDLASVEKRAIEAALRHTNGNRTKAAALLGVNRQTLYNKLAEWGVK